MAFDYWVDERAHAGGNDMNAMEQYMMQRELDEALTRLAQIRAVLNGYPDSDLVDLRPNKKAPIARGFFFAWVTVLLDKAIHGPKMLPNRLIGDAQLLRYLCLSCVRVALPDFVNAQLSGR
jgi:hypothetical protein